MLMLGTVRMSSANQTKNEPVEPACPVRGGLDGRRATGLPDYAMADVTLGVLLPASGRAASYGQQQQSAIEMFMERYADLGKAGKLKLIVYDTRGENTEAINLTRKLISTETCSRWSARNSARKPR